DLRPHPDAAGFHRVHGPVPARGHREVHPDRPGALRRAARRGRGRDVPRQDATRAVPLAVVPRRPRRLQRTAPGGPEMIEVVKPGLSTTVQDAGRSGYYHLGIPPSGALDQYSLRAANLLVGNPAGAAALEAVYMGPELAFTTDAVVAVTGATMVPKVNGEERPVWESFPVSAGDVLSFAYLTAGARAYIAVSGGIDVPEVLGSRSTYALGALGGVSGRPIAAGDRLPIGRASGATPGRSVPADLRPTLSKEVEVRVVMGLYDYRLTDAGRAAFLDSTWDLTPEADRIGFRYAGPQLETVPREPPFGAGQDPSNIVDAP